MKQIQLHSGVFLLVEVPEDANTFVAKETLNALVFYEGAPSFESIRDRRLPPGQWEIIGKGNEIKEYDGINGKGWRSVCDVDIRKDGKGEAWKDYENDGNELHYAKESGHSWIKSHGMKPETTLILKLKNNE